MESGDENFAWTDASTDSDNETMAVTKQNGGDDSESGYSYKEKIQNELFENKHHIKEESIDTKKPKKRKLNNLDHSVIDEPKKKHIKLEPESDLDMHNKKRKSCISDNNSILQEEEFLNFKVKEEQFIADSNSSKSKKKKKKMQREGSQESAMCTSSLGESQSIVFENSPCENEAIVNISELSQEDVQLNVKEETLDTDSDRTKKKKSKKRKKDRHSLEETMIEEKFSAEETIVEQRRPKVQQSEKINAVGLEKPTPKKKEISHSFLGTDRKSNEDSDHSMTGDEHQNSISMIEPNNLSVDKGKSANDYIKSSDKIISSNSSKDLPQRISKIADRIRFEEDTLNFSQDEECNNKLEHSKQLKQFLKTNNHLKHISPMVQGDTIITDDDEVWVLKCPSEVNVNSLKDTNLVLDNKCKLKADSQTYVGIIENNVDNITILTLGQSNPVIKNVTLSGTVHFRKRIPKPHYIEHNIIENKQTNFIPLPETKHRHPLFGSNYKSAIKVRKSIAQRLNGHEPESISDDNEKRKKKKKKHKQEVVESDNEPDTKQEHEHIEVRKKKKRKRSHNDDKTQSKLAKKLKHEPDSETWESEQAIEQQLFNF